MMLPTQGTGGDAGGPLVGLPQVRDTDLFNEAPPEGGYLEIDVVEGYDEKCAEYGVHPDGNEARPNQVSCNNCGIEFASLADRMLREPKLMGCHGCQLKSGHG